VARVGHSSLRNSPRRTQDREGGEGILTAALVGVGAARFGLAAVTWGSGKGARRVAL
jgi:hypothetical protein